jgi:hypothetical protein
MGACKVKRRDGSPCPAPAVGDSEFCIFHAPNVSAERRRELRSMGGRPPTWEKQAGTVGLTSEDVLSLIAEVVENLRSMQQDARTANAMLAAARLTMDMIEVYQLGEKAVELEELLRGLNYAEK